MYVIANRMCFFFLNLCYWWCCCCYCWLCLCLCYMKKHIKRRIDLLFCKFQFFICKKLFKSEAHRHIDHMNMNISSIAKNKYVFDR